MLLKIQYASDLHFGFPENREYFKKHPIKPVSETLILAGDIIPFNSLERYPDSLKYFSDHFKTVYWLPGNHEYYKYDIALKSGILNEKITDNIFLVNNISIMVDEVKLIFTTLWSSISQQNAPQIEKGLMDFRLIRFHDQPFTANVFNQLHKDSVAFLKNNLPVTDNQKTIVVTHHVPTYRHYPEKYIGSVLNQGFATDMDKFITDSKFNYWIYGHHHHNTQDFTIGKTRMLTNQLGYVAMNEHAGFRPAAYLEI